MNEQTKQFILDHLSDDVRRLALTKPSAEVDIRFALQQIDGRQRAKSKLPTLTSNMDVLFPVHLSVEQCSSEVTAKYKADILKACISRRQKEGALVAAPNVLVDLTGGFGIDFMALSPSFTKAIYTERNEELCEMARQNFPTLGIDNAEVVNAEAENLLNGIRDNDGNCDSFSLKDGVGERLFFIDPARRSETGSRTFAISDCTPDVISLMPRLKELGTMLFLKLSPMLDWHKAVEDIEKCGADVMEVHIVSVRNECKELLLLVDLQHEPLTETRLFCKNDDSLVEISNAVCAPNDEEKPLDISGVMELLREPQNAVELLLPNASIMKAGCWDFICQRYKVTAAGDNSHLFFANHVVEDFPGKRYSVKAICSMNKKEVKKALAGIDRANVAVRNFPLTAEDLRKRLKLKDGGSVYVFGTTINGEHKVVVATLAQINKETKYKI